MDKWEEEYNKLHERFNENTSNYTLNERIFALCWVIVQLLLRMAYDDHK